LARSLGRMESDTPQMKYRSRSGKELARQARVEHVGIERADAELLEILDADFGEARRRAGSWLECRPGCAACCHGPFPITRLDVWRLRRGLDTLSSTEPELAAAIRRRAARCREALASGFPGDVKSGRLSRNESLLDRFFEGHATLACPALDPGSGTCSLHPWRPVSCRNYGPPIRFGEKESPPCDLCFRGASRTTVERCRIEPDRDGLEEAILAHMGVVPDDPWETLIAIALAADPAPEP
jgi:Fe-S-cluster containining protein